MDDLEAERRARQMAQAEDARLKAEGARERARAKRVVKMQRRYLKWLKAQEQQGRRGPRG